MATVKSVSTIIGGHGISPYYVHIQQSSDWHHRFEIAVSSEKMEGSAYSVSIDNSIELIGRIAEIYLERAGGQLHFKGIITKVKIDRTYTGDNLIVFSGYSLTYLMEDGIGVQSYENQNIKDILHDILNQYATNLIQPQIQPHYTSKIPYIVRYKETNFQFIHRIAATYGEWFYYDGQSIIFGKLPNPKSLELTLGKDLSSFDYGVQLRPSKFKYQSYNYEENSILETASKNFKPGWLDNYGKKALDISDKIFPGYPINPTWQDAPDIPLLKHMAESRKASMLSDTTFFKGHSTHSGITVGSKIQVKAINHKEGRKISVHIGNFRVTAITHTMTANKDYYNTFEAIPLSITAPPVNTNVFKPEAESQIALVKANDDPAGLGRVRVQFKWQTREEMTPWIRQLTHYAGDNRGTYFVPEIGDEVYVGFEQGNPDRPYIQGAMYHGKTPPEYFNKDNNLKAIKTRSGHTVLFDDTEGNEKIKLFDNEGSIIIFDTQAKSLTINATENIDIAAKNIRITAEENIDIEAKKTICTASEGETSILSKDDIALRSAKNTSLSSNGKIDIEATEDVSTKGKNVSSEGTIEAKLKGGQTKVEGKIAVVQGASGKIDVL